jgi:hypothetical protein
MTEYYPFIIENGKKVYITSPLNPEKMNKWKREVFLSFLKIKQKEFAEGFTSKSQRELLDWFCEDNYRDISFDYQRRIKSDKKITYAEYRKNWKYEEGRDFDLHCENEIFSFEEFLVADEQTIRGIASCSIIIGGEADEESDDYWNEHTRLRDLVIFDYISSEGEENFFKRMGWDLSDSAIYKNMHTGHETTIGEQYSQQAFDSDGHHRHASRREWLLHDLHTFFENWTPKEKWTNEWVMEEYKKKQSTLFGSTIDDKKTLTKVKENVSYNSSDFADDVELSDEELAEEYPVESGEVEDEPIQSTLFEKPNTRKLVCKCGKEYVVTDKESNFDCSCGKMLVWTIGNEVNYLTPAVAIHSKNGAVQSVAEAILKGKIQPIQSTLTGAVANNKEKEKILLAEQEHLNQIWWLKRAIDTIAEVDNGKVFDNNEKDGLGREFEIGSAGFEELGMLEEDYEALSFEQYVKKSLEKIIEFNIQEMGMELEQATIFSYERIENRLAEIEKELKLCKTKMKYTKSGEKIVQLSLAQN